MGWELPTDLREQLYHLVVLAWPMAAGRYQRGRKICGHLAADVSARSRQLRVKFPGDVLAFLEVVDEKMWAKAHRGRSRLHWLTLPNVSVVPLASAAAGGGRGSAVVLGRYENGWHLLVRLDPDADGDRHVLAAGGDGTVPVLLAKSLAHWIARLIGCEFREPAVLHDDLDALRPHVRLDFLADHLTLNPADEWGRLTLAAEQSPDAEGQSPPQGRIDFDRSHESGTLRIARSERGVDSVTLRHTAYDDVSALKGLTDLRSLFLNLGREEFDSRRCKYVVHFGAPIRLSQIAPHPLLELLDCGCCDLRELDAIGGLPNLRRLSLDRCRWATGERLVVPPGLVVFEGQQSMLSDLSPLAGANRLTNLWVPHSRVHDLRPVARLPALESVNISGTRVTDLRPIHAPSPLRSLTLAKGQITDADLQAFRNARPDVDVELKSPYDPPILLDPLGDWPWRVPPDTPIMTSGSVFRDNQIVLAIVRPKDGPWIFKARDSIEDDLERGTLVDMLRLDPSIATAFDLKPGWMVARLHPNAPWSQMHFNPDE